MGYEWPVSGYVLFVRVCDETFLGCEESCSEINKREVSYLCKDVRCTRMSIKEARVGMGGCEENCCTTRRDTKEQIIREM